MEGGVAFFLLLIIGVVVVVGGLALYLTGGTLLSTDGSKDGEGGRRPKHKRPKNPSDDKIELVGTKQDDERA